MDELDKIVDYEKNKKEFETKEKTEQMISGGKVIKSTDAIQIKVQIWNKYLY